MKNKAQSCGTILLMAAHLHDLSLNNAGMALFPNRPRHVWKVPGVLDMMYPKVEKYVLTIPKKTLRY